MPSALGSFAGGPAAPGVGGSVRNSLLGGAGGVDPSAASEALGFGFGDDDALFGGMGFGGADGVGELDLGLDLDLG